jgi:hypothetical protein
MNFGTRRVGACARAVVLLAALVGLSACGAGMKPPTAADIAGLAPSGTVTLSETFVVAVGEGKGTLNFQGGSYPFRLVGGIVGPAFSLSELHVSGEVYKLNKVSDFAGAYAQRSGPPGLQESSAGDLWLQNSNGVVMHLTGKAQGATLSLGRDEIYVQMN